MTRRIFSPTATAACFALFAACSDHEPATPLEDAEVKAIRGNGDYVNTVTACADDLTSCLEAKPVNYTACINEAQQCGLFSLSGAFALTAAQLACSERFTTCTLAQPTNYAACLTEAESCGLLPAGTVTRAADGGVSIASGLPWLGTSIPLPPLPSWDGGLPGVVISDAGVATIPGIVIVDGGVGVAIGPVFECANKLFACLAQDPSKATECTLDAEKCLAAAQP